MHCNGVGEGEATWCASMYMRMNPGRDGEHMVCVSRPSFTRASENCGIACVCVCVCASVHVHGNDLVQEKAGKREEGGGGGGAKGGGGG